MLLVCFSRAGDESVSSARLDGQPVDDIYTDLTARRGSAGVDLTGVRRLPANAGRATFTIWLSRPAANDAAGQAVALAGDLARLRHTLAALDVDDDGRVNVGDRIATELRPRDARAVTVVGAVRLTFDYEATGDYP